MPDLSHFAMAERWYQGDTEGTAAPATGFLGRICDAIHDGAPVTGVSLGGGSGRLLSADRAGTIALPGIDGTWFLSPDNDEARGLRNGLDAFGDGAFDGPAALVAQGTGQALDFADLVNGLPDQESEAENDLGWKLLIASHLIAADVGVRVVHVSMDGDFDTHEDHRGTHDSLMESFDLAMAGFHRHLAEVGMADRLLVATMSEFGRRPEENDSAGLDHGTASTMLLSGPVAPGRHGEPPSLTDLDEDGNLIATVTLGSYQATLAGWLGVPAEEISIDASQAIPGVLP